jgi:hypothetical protein
MRIRILSAMAAAGVVIGGCSGGANIIGPSN